MKGILFGNGLNLRLGLKQLDTDAIYKRFIDKVLMYSELIEVVFSISMMAEQVRGIFDEHSADGIEIDAGRLYDFIKRNSNKEIWSYNDEDRLQDVITSMAILSIFYDNNGLINHKVDKSKMPNIKCYEKVFTLNYVEFWDDNDISIPLHGRVNFDNLMDVENAFFYNPKLCSINEYSKSIEKMKLRGNAIEFDPFECVFAPDRIKKQDLFCISGIYPGDKWFPSEDLFPHDQKVLYEELKTVDDLVVFGVSPDGDSSLIDAINEIKHVSIYVFKKDENRHDDVQKWEELLVCPHELLDSSTINSR